MLIHSANFIITKTGLRDYITFVVMKFNCHSIFNKNPRGPFSVNRESWDSTVGILVADRKAKGSKPVLAKNPNGCLQRAIKHHRYISFINISLQLQTSSQSRRIQIILYSSCSQLRWREKKMTIRNVVLKPRLRILKGWSHDWKNTWRDNKANNDYQVRNNIPVDNIFQSRPISY